MTVIIVAAAALVAFTGLVGLLAAAQWLADWIANRRGIEIPDRREDHSWVRDVSAPMTYLPWIRRHLRKTGGAR